MASQSSADGAENAKKPPVVAKRVRSKRGSAVGEGQDAADASKRVRISMVASGGGGGVPPDFLTALLGGHTSDGLTRDERSYLETLPEAKRNDILSELRCATSNLAKPIRFRVLESSLPAALKQDVLVRLASESCSGKLEGWVNAALSLPMGKWSPRPRRALSDICGFLAEARQRLDRSIYGQEEAKDECIRLLCTWANTSRNPSTQSNWAIGLQGLPGIGKTLFAQVLAQVMRRPFVCISLAGVYDSSLLLGHSYTYEGAMEGRIAAGLRQCGRSDPVLYFDEVDKTSKTRGDDIGNTLVNITDRQQNSAFRDKFFAQIDIDLSRAIMVFSYNDASQVNAILQDRLMTMQFKPPSRADKVCIAQQFLIPRALKASGLSNVDMTFDSVCIEEILDHVPDEAGVRGLDKTICRLVNTMLVLVKGSTLDVTKSLKTQVQLPLTMNKDLVRKCVTRKAEGASEVSASLMYL